LGPAISLRSKNAIVTPATRHNDPTALRMTSMLSFSL
jgi:hypothetical protein